MTLSQDKLNAILLRNRPLGSGRPVAQTPIAGTGMYDGRSCSRRRGCQGGTGDRDRGGYLTGVYPNIPKARHLCQLYVEAEAGRKARVLSYYLCDVCAEAFCKKRGIVFHP